MYELLKKKWQWHALTMLRQTLPTPAVRRLVRWCFRRYPKGFIAQVQDGDVPARYHSLATYLAKYVVSPPISVRRIDRYDGRRVTYHYRSHRTERVEQETVDVHRFIGRMVQHVVPKGFKRVRYYGVQAAKSFAKLKPMIQAALAKVQHVIRGAVKIIAPMTYRKRYHQSTGRDPLRCSHCQGEMALWRMWHPKYGVIYDEAKRIRRGDYERRRERAPTDQGGLVARRALACNDRHHVIWHSKYAIFELRGQICMSIALFRAELGRLLRNLNNQHRVFVFIDVIDFYPCKSLKSLSIEIVTIDTHCTSTPDLVILSNHRIVPPYGMAGGEEGQCGKNWVERADGTIVDMTGQDGTRVGPGDVFVLQTPTGGGYGPTSERVELAPETAE